MLSLFWIVTILVVRLPNSSAFLSSDWTTPGLKINLTKDEAPSTSDEQSSRFTSHLTPWYLSQSFDVSLTPFVRSLRSTENDQYIDQPSSNQLKGQQSFPVPNVTTQRQSRAVEDEEEEEGEISSLTVTGKRQPNPPWLNKDPYDEDIRRIKEKPSSYLMGSSDTLDALLHFLSASGSPVDGLLELRSLLLAQKEEKIILASFVDEMRLDLQGIRYQLRLQSEEIQVHAEEITHLKMALDLEKSRRSKLEVLFQLQSIHWKRDHSSIAPPFEQRSTKRGNDEIRAHQYTRNNSGKWHWRSSVDSQLRPTLDYDPSQPSIPGNLQNEGDRKASSTMAAKQTQSDVFRGLKLLQTLLRAPTSFETRARGDENVQSRVRNHSIGIKTSHKNQPNSTTKGKTMVSQLKSLVRTLDQELRSALVLGPGNSLSRPKADLLDSLFEDMKTTVVHVIGALRDPKFQLLRRPKDLALLEKIFLEFQMRARTLLTQKGTRSSKHGSRNELGGAFQRLMEVTVELIVDLRVDVNRLHEGQLKQTRDIAALRKVQSSCCDTPSPSLAIKVDHLQRMVNERLPEVLGLMAQMLSKDLRTKESTFSPNSKRDERETDTFSLMRTNSSQGSIPSYVVDESDLTKINIAKRQIDEKINEVKKIARQVSGKEVNRRKEINKIIHGLQRISAAIGMKTKDLEEVLQRRETQKKSSLSSSHSIQKRIWLSSQGDKKARFDPSPAQLLSSSVRNESSSSSLSPEAHEVNDVVPPQTLLQLAVAISKLRELESKPRRKTFGNDEPTKGDVMKRLEHFESTLRALESRFETMENQPRRRSPLSFYVPPATNISKGSRFQKYFGHSVEDFKMLQQLAQQIKTNCANCISIQSLMPDLSDRELEQKDILGTATKNIEGQLNRTSSAKTPTTIVRKLYEQLKWLAKGQSRLANKVATLSQHGAPYSQMARSRFGSTPSSLTSKEWPEMMNQVIAVLGSMDSALDSYKRQVKTLIDFAPSELPLATFEHKLDQRDKDEQKFRRDVLFVLTEFERDITLIKAHLINSTKTFPINETHGPRAYWQTRTANKERPPKDENEMAKLRSDVNKLNDLLLPENNYGTINPFSSQALPSNDTALSQEKTAKIYLLLARLHLDLDAIRLDLKKQTLVADNGSSHVLKQRMDRLEETLKSFSPLFQTVKTLSWNNYLTRRMVTQNAGKQKIFLHNWWASLRDVCGILEVVLEDHLQLRNHVGRIQSFSIGFQDIKTSLNVISQKVQTLEEGLGTVLPGSTNHARSSESRTFGQPGVAPSPMLKEKLLGLRESIGALHSRVDRLPMVSKANQTTFNGMRREITKLKEQVSQFLPLSKYIENIGPLRGLDKTKLVKLKGIMTRLMDVSKALVKALEDVERLEIADHKILRLSSNDILRLARELHRNLVQIRRNSQRNTMLYMGVKTYYDDKMADFEKELRSQMNVIGPLKRALNEKISELPNRVITRLRQELLQTRAMNESQTEDQPKDLRTKLHALERLINEGRSLHEGQMDQRFSLQETRLQRIEEDMSHSERKQKTLDASFAKLSSVLATLVDHFLSWRSQLDHQPSIPSNWERRLRSLEHQTRRLASKLSLTTNPSSFPQSRSQKNGGQKGQRVLKFQRDRNDLTHNYERLVAKLVNGLETRLSSRLERKHKLQLPREMPHIILREVLRHLARQRNDLVIRELSRIKQGLNLLSKQVKRMQTMSPGNSSQDGDKPGLEQILRQVFTEFHYIVDHLKEMERNQRERHVRLIPADDANAKYDDEQIKQDVFPGVSKSLARKFDALIDNFLRSMNQSRHKLAEITHGTDKNRVEMLSKLYKYVDDVVDSALTLKRTQAMKEYQEVSSQLARLETEINGIHRNRDQGSKSALKLLLGHDFALRQLMDYILVVARKVAAKGSDLGHGHFLSPNLKARAVLTQTKQDIREIRRLLEHVKIRWVLQTHQSLMDLPSSRNLSHTLTRLEDRLQAAIALGQFEKDSRSKALMELQTLLNKGETLKADLEELLNKAKVAQKLEPRVFVESHEAKSDGAKTKKPPQNLSDEITWSSKGFQAPSAQSQRWDLLDSARRAPTPQEPSNAFFQDFGPQICCPSLRTQIQEQQSKLVLVELNLNQSLLAQARLRHLVQDLTTEIQKDFVKKVETSGWIHVIEGNWLNIRRLNQSLSRHILETTPANQMWFSRDDPLNRPQLQPYPTNMMLPIRSQETISDNEIRPKSDCSSKSDGFQDAILPTGRSIRVMCQDHGVVIQSRSEPPHSTIKFQKSWNQYVTGFGNVEDDDGFWLGLETLHYLSNPPGTFSIDLWFQSGQQFHIKCKNFSIGAEEDDFIIKSAKCFRNQDSSGSLLPSRFLSSGRRFATADHHYSNTHPFEECSNQLKGGWWFPSDQCQVVNPNLDNQASSEEDTPEGHQNVIRRSRMVFQPEMGPRPSPNEILLMNNHPQSKLIDVSEILRYPHGLTHSMNALGTSSVITQRRASFPSSSSFAFPASSISSSSSSSSLLFPGYLGTGIPTIQLNNINVFPKSLDPSSDKQPMEHGAQSQESQEDDDDEHLPHVENHQSFHSLIAPPNQDGKE